MNILEITDLTKRFGGLTALSKMNIEVREGEILGLIGPNGSGKSTLFNVLCGFYRPNDGSVVFKGEDITHLQTHQIAQKGIGRTFQEPTYFAECTVLQNVIFGFHMRYRTSGLAAFLHASRAREEEKGFQKKALEILEFLGLAEFENQLASNLPYGNARVLETAMAMATNPKLLLLDEPMTGMNPTETSRAIGTVKQLKKEGMTIIIIEHDMRAIMNLSDRIVALQYGEKIAEGSPEEIRRNKRVIEAYLGTLEDSKQNDV
jgi:branched-chain amino acid transport system ATP-binding protein